MTRIEQQRSALPVDVEVFHLTAEEINNERDPIRFGDWIPGAGWYWQMTTPPPEGCDRGAPIGPFDTEAGAIADAQAMKQPTDEQVYDALESAIETVCDVDTRNDISREYRRIMREQGFIEGNEEDESDGELPPCVLAMGCYCAGHARGNPASEPCNTSEQL